MRMPIDLSDDTLTALGELVIALRDSQVGLAETGSKVRDREVVRLFYRIASERADMEQELSDVIRTNERHPPDSTSWLGELRNTWLRIRTSISNGDLEVVLGQVKRSEALIVAHFDRLLPRVTDNSLHELLVEQYQIVRGGQDAVSELHELHRAR